jgi:hypothetical protein
MPQLISGCTRDAPARCADIYTSRKKATMIVGLIRMKV